MEKDKKESAEKTKKAPAKKKVAVSAGKPPEKKAPSGAKAAAKKKDLDVQRERAEVRTAKEENSIAPTSDRLGDPFAKYRRSAPSASTPSVVRVAAGGSLPVKPKPAEEPKPAAQPPAPLPPPAAGGTAKPAPQAVKPPEPTATYKLDVPPVKASAPASAPQRPAALPAAKPPVPGAPAALPAAPGAPAAKPAAPGAPAAKPAVPGVPAARPPVPGIPGARPPVPGAPAARPPVPGIPGARPPVPGAPAARPPVPGIPGARPPVPGAPVARPPVPGIPGARPPVPGAPAARPAAPAARPAAKPAAPVAPAQAAEQKPPLTPLQVTTNVTVRELAEKMSVKVNDLIKKLMGQGVFVTINQRLDSETAILVSADFGFDLEVKPLHMEAEISAAAAVEDKPQDLQPRSPVVTIMGHVDHGKTSLLDAIRSTNVVAGESGGITQHIGAYKVKIPKGEIVFLDTPGHAAFTAMRSRGAKVTDIVVLVVSATDGVMPQTVEAIDHAKAAGVPIVVAVNKIDLPAANPQKIRQELSKHGLLSEEWGGKNIFVDISAKKRLNLDKLLEMLLLQAELLELKANPNRSGQGVVIEARMDPKRGSVATVLVQNGSVSIGDAFVMGLCSGKAKALISDTGERLRSAGPATPVEVLGISGGVPQAGDAFNVVAGESTAKGIAAKRSRIHREEALAHKHRVSLTGLRSSRYKELPVILKADAQGSVEAIKDQIEKLSTTEISVRVIHAGLGNASESDVMLAGASNAVVLLFHVDQEPRASETAQMQGVEVHRYEIIYDLVADVKAALEGLLEPEVVDVVVGRAEVRQVFNIRGSSVAGCFVVEGKLARGCSVRVFRGNSLAGEGRVDSLKRFKDDVKEVEKNMECGVGLGSFGSCQVGDRIEAFAKEKRMRRLESPA